MEKKEIQQAAEAEKSTEKIWKRKHWHPVISGFLILAMAISFFFLLFRFEDLCAKISALISILIPFIYGGVMAYMLRMPCNFFEKYLEKWLPKKMKKRAGGFAILLSLFCAGLILYLLISMVVGVVIAIFQAATQINEQTLTFVPKFLAILVVMGLLGSTLLGTLQDLFRNMLTIIVGS